jgi:hypothetical protein
MHAGQVLDMQADLLTRLTTNAYFHKVTAMTVGGSRKDPHVYQSYIATDQGESLVNAMTNHVQAAYAYRVTEEMSDLVLHAASVLEDEDTIDLSLPPTGCGIVRFDKPLPLIDARGKTMLIHWATWGPATVVMEDGGTLAGLMTSTWNDLDDPDEVAVQMFREAEERGQSEEGLRRELGRWTICGVSIMEPGATLGPPTVSLNEHHTARIAAEGDTPQAYTNIDRYMHALWLLLNQTIVTTEEEPVASAFRRRALKKNLPGRVTVIRLRRSSNTSHAGESHVEWSHRWIVRGHWRWAPCGPGRTQRRRIWIHSHIRGPEGLPLIVTDKVYSLDR